MLYSILKRAFPATAIVGKPRRIVFLRPCCIGDVVMATAALSALRETFPAAHISWAVGPWSARAIEHHPAVNALLDIGEDMPLRSPATLLRLVNRLRGGDFDLAVSLVRSPLMSLALLLAGIPIRAGLDSGGRGFGYNLRVAIDPAAREHESEIYLKAVSAVAGHQVHAYANLPVTEVALASIRARIAEEGVDAPFIVAHPGGGVNPGAQLAEKRFPPRQFAETLNRVAAARVAGVILLGGPGDGELVAEIERQLNVRSFSWVDRLTFQEIGALASEALVYIGNDSGLTHLAAASGAKTVMLMGPTDPKRYAPYTSDHLALWKSVELGAGGAVNAARGDWHWARDGVSPEEAVAQILAFLDR
ncbi:MAG: glycosyltransferase family 9 protein [Chloroflexi bacterium]|nr:glycosyltransferase family 9 protein [Chloroflexota bacterium]